MASRREFLKTAILVGAGVSIPLRFGSIPGLIPIVAAAQTPLQGRAIPQFIDRLPLLDLAGGPMKTVVDDGSLFEIHMREFLANVMPSTFAPATGTYAGTWVWGYIPGATAPTNPLGTYIGPVIVARRGTPTNVRYVNDLGSASSTNLVSWMNATDLTLHWADPLNGEADACERAVVPGQPPSAACAAHYTGPIPAVAHLHGGEVPALFDGGPSAWFTSDGVYHGHDYFTNGLGGNGATYQYPNTQEAAMIWFHDHALGITRLNVYAGLAGAYAIIDENLSLPTGLHPVGLQQGSGGSVDYIIPMVIQDRSFDVNGQFFFPNLGINPDHPYWVPEFVGDTIVVNGKVWPFLNVEPRRYRFLFLNGSNARTYEMYIVSQANGAAGPPLWQIGTDGGYLDVPVQLNSTQKLLLMPGERADVIIDFAGFEGQTLILRNTGNTPFPKGGPPNGSTLGRLVQFRVGPGPVSDASFDPATGAQLRQPIIRLADPVTGALAANVNANKIRQLTLNEVLSAAGAPLEVLVNNTKFDGLQPGGTTRADFTPLSRGGVTEYFSELPNEGETELWEIVNLTADAHPIHTHLTQFQILNRQKFNTNKYNAAYLAAFTGGVYSPGFGPPLDYATGNTRALGGNPDITPYLQGPVRPPRPNEAGWKDTAVMYPGQVTRIVVRYAPTDKAINDPDLYFPFEPCPDNTGFVWHCHIIDHEDNEMMRPLRVIPKTGITR
jgi:spore coat protein A